ncbi:MAG: ABC transporter substrate-binding protein [Acutalibacteraceae bacterium]
MKKAMKIIAVALSLLLVVGSFAACSNKTEDSAYTVGMLYCSGEANSKYQVEKVTEELVKLGYAVKEYSFADSNELASVLNKAVTEVKAIYVPTDNTCANNTELINNIAEPAGIPIIAGEEGICKGCGIATLSISYYDLGVATANMAYEILVNGADISTMDISYVEASTLVKKADMDRAEKLGIAIPDTFTAIGAEAEDNKKEEAEVTPADLPEGKVFNIGICQLVQHPALDAATQGFQDRLIKLLGEDHVKFNVQNAANESAICATIVNQFVSANVDLILANATPALQAAVSATQDIPILGTSVTEYGVALGIENFDGKTGINVSGTSDLAPLDQQAALFAELLPINK